MSHENSERGEQVNHAAVGRKCVIRTLASGVFMGTVVEAYPHSTGKFTRAVVADCRRLWKWAGAFTLSEVAQTGIDAANSRVSLPVSGHCIEDCVEFIPVTEEAARTIEEATSETPAGGRNGVPLQSGAGDASGYGDGDGTGLGKGEAPGAGSGDGTGHGDA